MSELTLPYIEHGLRPSQHPIPGSTLPHLLQGEERWYLAKQYPSEAGGVTRILRKVCDWIGRATDLLGVISGSTNTETLPLRCGAAVRVLRPTDITPSRTGVQVMDKTLYLPQGTVLYLFAKGSKDVRIPLSRITCDPKFLLDAISVRRVK